MCTTKLLGSFFFSLSLPDRNLETSMRIYFHFKLNPFSKESQDVIKAAGNTELCELLDVEPKAQCKVCLSYWDVGIVYCTCGHFLRDDTKENKKYIQLVLDLFSIHHYYIRKVDPTVTATGRKKGITSTSSRISSKRNARKENS